MFKKAKYLQDVDGEAHPIAPANGLLNYPLASNYEFGSKATSLEYSFLSNMLGAPSGDFALPDMGLGQVGLASVDNVNQPSQTHHGSRESLGTTNSPVAAQDSGHAARASGVYKSVVRPYDYREGFHNLVKYVKERMEKNDIIRICRALAGFRPSFMAQIMNLSEEDLLFMEKCFQRTIMEFDKLIGFSGTPTVVWRRTGEIALVGKEFSILTQWPREQLLGKRTYIYELMDNSSAVDYWEKFSLIAFDNSQQSMMTTCTVLTPTGRPVTCAFCFTIKRDIFDVPLAIVGNFLPLFRAV
ncbi:Transcriptional regulator of nonfermentable carbon utilization [Gaertneriomyces sp. JEL0708]|nr:Transcriptional regulator of nonfermentable carbon utilization [Gaertneriomyces sp. JEL0708]